MSVLIPGDVVLLKAGTLVLVNRKDLMNLDRDAECVCEALRSFAAGSEDDHFVPGSVADLRALNPDGSFDWTSPVLTVGLEGDFAPEFMPELGPVLRRMKRTWVPEV